MSRCKECILCEICREDKMLPAFDENQEALCKAFKPKSRFVELPCEVGQTVYFIGVLSQQIVPSKTMSVLYNNGGFHFLCENGLVVTETEQLGKTVFLSREEAEKALAERSK